MGTRLGNASLIYVLAAYSITVGTLALYGVLMQHRARLYALDQSSPAGQSLSGRPLGFNLGAALLSPFWMWGHGMRAAGVVLLVLCLVMVPLYDRGPSPARVEVREGDSGPVFAMS